MVKIKSKVRYYVSKSYLKNIDLPHYYEVYSTDDPDVVCIEFSYKGSLSKLIKLTRKIRPIEYEYDDITLYIRRR